MKKMWLLLLSLLMALALSSCQPAVTDTGLPSQTEETPGGQLNGGLNEYIA